MPKFKNYNQNQPMLLPPNIKDWLPSNHICFVINDIVDNLDISSIEDTYSEQGSPAYNPKALIKTMFYSYTQGNRSSRKIEKGCYENLVMRYLSASQCPDHGTISLFRKSHLSCLEDLFVQIVIMSKELNIINPRKISIDGTIFKANSSWKNTVDQKSIAKLKKNIRKMLRQAEEIDQEEDKKYGKEAKGYEEMPEKLRDKEARLKEIKRLKKKLEQLNQAEEIIDEKQEEVKDRPKEERELKRNTTYNTTDDDANTMKMKNSNSFKPGYNGQIAANNQIILAYDITDDADDTNSLAPMVEKTENNTREKVDELSADSKYFSKDNIEKIMENEIDAYIPDQRKALEEKQERNNEVPKYDKRNFKYDSKRDEYICPQGKRLRLVEIRKDGTKRYQGYDCGYCPAKNQCTKGKRRSVYIDPELEKYKSDMRKKLNTKEGKARYLERLSNVEAPFGNIIYNQQARNFLCRGKPMVKIEFGLSCVAHNLVKIANWIKQTDKKQQFDALMRLGARI